MNQWSDKLLGFGLMRLPKKDDVIELDKVCEMVDAFLANGFTYFDTAYVYPGAEIAFREAVAKRHPRERYTVATKLAAWLLKEGFTAEDMFRESLERCGVDYFDYYLLHSLQPSRIAAYEEQGCWEFGRKMKEEGKVRHLGFSFHGDPTLLDQLLTDHPDIDFVQLQINYADWDDDAIFAKGNYEVCRKHGKDIVVMEPVKGGILAELKPEAMEKFRALDPAASAASYALRYVGSLPGVKMILSGMGTMEQLLDNMDTFRAFKPLSEEEQKAVQDVVSVLQSSDAVPCTNCRYCVKGCPQGILIPDIFRAYNMILNFGDHNRPHFYYAGLQFEGSGKANSCIECGQCEAACPQHIAIVDQLKAASKHLDK